MKYQVTLHNKSNIQVGIPKAEKRVIDVSKNNVESMSDLGDVNSQDRQNNYVLVWDTSLEKHVYISPSKILDLADNVDDDAIDYGTY
jgi:hypothetical protein